MRPVTHSHYIKPVIDRATGMNKTETRYSQQLELLKRTGEIIDWKFEAVKLRLADKTFYTADFLVIFPTHMELHEVKGFWQDDARVKIKIAAVLYPWFKFLAVKAGRRGVFEVENF